MREIKFRGKPVYRGGKAISWVYGTFKYIPCNIISPGSTDNGRRELRHDKGIIIEPLYCSEFEVICDTVSEFTGLHDKNGKEIYEHDIVRHTIGKRKDKTGEFVDDYRDIEVCYDRGSFNISSLSLCLEYVEVIGNIFDSPKLLKT